METETTSRSMAQTTVRLLVKVGRCRDRTMIWDLVRRTIEADHGVEGEEAVIMIETEGEDEEEDEEEEGEVEIAVDAVEVGVVTAETVDRAGVEGEVDTMQLVEACQVGRRGCSMSTGSRRIRSRLHLSPGKTA